MTTDPARWDHLPWPGDALAAWIDSGLQAEAHQEAQAAVREAMPGLARALDRAAEDKLSPEPPRPRRLKAAGESYPPPPWERRGGDRWTR